MFKRTFLSTLAAVAVFLSAAPVHAQLNPASGSVTRPTSELGALREQINPVNRWTYVAASGGITDTTAVTIKASAGVGKRNYITACQIANSGAAGTEVWLVSGAAGTIIWRGYIAAAVSSQEFRFPVPLQSAVNTLLEVDMSSGTTIAVRVNCQGYTD